MATEPGVDRTGLVIGVAVGIPVTVAVAAVMATAPLVLRHDQRRAGADDRRRGVAAVGGRAAGIVTALTAVVSFDFFHTQPYLSLAIDSRDDIETTVLLLVAAVLVGTIATAGRSARRRGHGAGRDPAHPPSRRGRRVRRRRRPQVIAIAQDELRDLLRCSESRFEALPDPTTDAMLPATRSQRCDRRRDRRCAFAARPRRAQRLRAAGSAASSCRCWPAASTSAASCSCPRPACAVAAGAAARRRGHRRPGGRGLARRRARRARSVPMRDVVVVADHRRVLRPVRGLRALVRPHHRARPDVNDVDDRRRRRRALPSSTDVRVHDRRRRRQLDRPRPSPCS